MNNDFIERASPPFPEKEAKSTFSRIGLGFIAFLTASYAAIFLIVWYANNAMPEIVNESWFYWLYYSVSLYGIGVPILWLILRKAPALPPLPQKMSGWRLFEMFLISLAVAYVLNFITQRFMVSFQTSINKELTNPLESILSLNPWYYTLIVTGIVAPIFEELICRKFIIDRTRKYGEITAALFSALIFMLIHANLYQMLYAFGLGFLFAVVYLKTGKLRYSIALHIGINMTGSVIPIIFLDKLDIEALYNLINDMDYTSTEGTAAFMSFISDNILAVSVLLIYFFIYMALNIWGFVLLIKNIRLIKRDIGPSLIPRGKRLEITLFNIGVILFILISVVLTYFTLML